MAAQAALDNAELRAPFSGTLADFDLKVGETVAPGQGVGTLADFTTWEVATDNLTEIDVVRITPGQGVSVVLDALPDHPLHGTVTAIDSVFAEKQGDITYTARIALTDADPLMRWGMTAAVTFDK
jgi:HlyD family secretion protein